MRKAIERAVAREIFGEEFQRRVGRKVFARTWVLCRRVESETGHALGNGATSNSSFFPVLGRVPILGVGGSAYFSVDAVSHRA